jgi:hypothetical protein
MRRWQGAILVVLAATIWSPVAHTVEPEGFFERGRLLAPDAIISAWLVDLHPPEEPLHPWVHNSMPDTMRGKVERAFDIAIRRVREVQECADLFAPFGADGIEILASTLYFPAGPHRQTTRCRHSFAVTSIGANTTWICRKVTAHPDERIAMALVHEALHHAGLGEYPIDRNGMRSRDINTLVSQRCHFD